MSAIPAILRSETRQGAIRVYLRVPNQTDAERAQIKAQLDAQLKGYGMADSEDLADIFVIVRGAERRQFRMFSLGWPAPDHPHALAARAIINSIADRCDVPELRTRVRENRKAELGKPLRFA